MGWRWVSERLDHFARSASLNLVCRLLCQNANNRSTQISFPTNIAVFERVYLNVPHLLFCKPQMGLCQILTILKADLHPLNEVPSTPPFFPSCMNSAVFLFLFTFLKRKVATPIPPCTSLAQVNDVHSACEAPGICMSHISVGIVFNLQRRREGRLSGVSSEGVPVEPGRWPS